MSRDVPIAVPLASSRADRAPRCHAAYQRIRPGALMLCCAVFSLSAGGVS